MIVEREDRPWGRFEVLYQEEGLKVKRIVVNPGQRLSLQSHEHRGEDWLILEGVARVELDNKLMHLHPHQVVHIPPGARHRVACESSGELVFVEVQRGDYLGEDDIVRYEDDYKRV
ncbi:MAG: phosphomannose isomerase type II C-terminal cupin domain [Acidobacteriota bacterium]|jgi:mannose-6-phosphate isomerase-like protein (cupin superfamily)|nr:phosphomannose isomerase type II C-terminal cupin domain [Acidobacteriota bacterium]